MIHRIRFLSSITLAMDQSRSIDQVIPSGQLKSHICHLFLIEPTRLTGRRDAHTPGMSSGGIQRLFKESESDCLLFYDACSSAYTAIAKTNSQGLTDLTTACGFHDTTPGVCAFSFTNTLTQVLTLEYRLR